MNAMVTNNNSNRWLTLKRAWIMTNRHHNSVSRFHLLWNGQTMHNYVLFQFGQFIPSHVRKATETSRNSQTMLSPLVWCCGHHIRRTRRAYKMSFQCFHCFLRHASVRTCENNRNDCIFHPSIQQCVQSICAAHTKERSGEGFPFNRLIF